MSLMARRRALLAAQEAGPSIPIGVNLYDRSAAGVVDGKYITKAVPGTASITYGVWDRYLTTAPMPYNSRYVFYTNATTVNSAGCVVLDCSGTVVFYGKNGVALNGKSGQDAVKNAERQFGLKGVAVIFSTINKSSFIWRRDL